MLFVCLGSHVGLTLRHCCTTFLLVAGRWRRPTLLLVAGRCRRRATCFFISVVSELSIAVFVVSTLRVRDVLRVHTAAVTVFGLDLFLLHPAFRRCGRMWLYRFVARRASKLHVRCRLQKSKKGRYISEVLENMPILRSLAPQDLCQA